MPTFTSGNFGFLSVYLERQNFNNSSVCQYRPLSGGGPRRCMLVFFLAAARVRVARRSQELIKVSIMNVMRLDVKTVTALHSLQSRYQIPGINA